MQLQKEQQIDNKLKAVKPYLGAVKPYLGAVKPYLGAQYMFDCTFVEYRVLCGSSLMKISNN